jgi:hypothetical protein
MEEAISRRQTQQQRRRKQMPEPENSELPGLRQQSDGSTPPSDAAATPEENWSPADWEIARRAVRHEHARQADEARRRQYWTPVIEELSEAYKQALDEGDEAAWLAYAQTLHRLLQPHNWDIDDEGVSIVEAAMAVSDSRSDSAAGSGSSGSGTEKQRRYQARRDGNARVVRRRNADRRGPAMTAVEFDLPLDLSRIAARLRECASLLEAAHEPVEVGHTLRETRFHIDHDPEANPTVIRRRDGE